MSRRVSELLVGLTMAMAVLASGPAARPPAVHRPVAVATWERGIGPMRWFGSMSPRVAGPEVGG